MKCKYEITEYENGLGDIYYELKRLDLYSWWWCGKVWIGNDKHAQRVVDRKVPKPFDTADVNYLYIFHTLKDVYKAIKEDKQERLANNFNKRGTIEVADA